MICAREGCEIEFVPGGRGKPKKYCSAACRVFHHNHDPAGPHQLDVARRKRVVAKLKVEHPALKSYGEFRGPKKKKVPPSVYAGRAKLYRSGRLPAWMLR